MARFILVNDFLTGEFKISQQDQTVGLGAIIDRIEEEALQDLLGKELYGLFIADLTVTFPTPVDKPQTARFTAIYDKFFESDPHQLRSEGMLPMLRMFIWFEYIQNAYKQNAPVGVVQNAFENSTPVLPSAANIEVTYNRALRTYNSIADKMILDRTTYPEFDGIPREVISFL